MIIHDVEQGTPEWFAIRLGRVTGSAMSSVLAKGQGKTRASLMYKLIGEKITGEPTEGYGNQHMERGTMLEPDAREIYEQINGIECEIVGFITEDFSGNTVGFSPDALVGDDGIAEIKTKLPHIQAELLISGRVPPEHTAQIQCGLWVTGRRWLDFISYWPGMPLFIKRVERDETYIATMAQEVAAFYAELNEKLEKIRAMA